MNWRLRFITAVIVALFIGFSFYYFRYYISPKPHAVILFILEGYDTNRIASSRPEAGKAFTRLLSSARRASLAVGAPGEQVDVASMSSWLSTGIRGQKGQLSLDLEGNPANTLLYSAQRSNRKVGLVSDRQLTSLPLAAFYTHTRQADDEVTRLLYLFDSTPLNVMLGTEETALAKVLEQEGRNLLAEAEARKFSRVTNLSELTDFPAWRTSQLSWWSRSLMGQFSADPAAADRPSLADLVQKAIQCLQLNLGGYFLIVHSDASELEPDAFPAQVEELRRAVERAGDYSGEKTILVLYHPYELRGEEVIPGGWASFHKAADPLDGGTVDPGSIHSYLLENF
jgi:alkaline phosphatase